MSQIAGQPAGRARRKGLAALIGGVARADRQAFARLYRVLAPDVAADLRRTVPDAATAAAIISATFVEVWWLARFHATPGKDVPAWVAGIAARRAHDRLLAAPVPAAGASDHAGAEPSVPLHVVQAVHDRRNMLALAALLDSHRAGRPRRRADRTGSVTVP